MPDSQDGNTTNSPTKVQTNLQGTWIACDGAASSVKFVFGIDSWSLYGTSYEDANCSVVATNRLIGRGKYTIENTTITSAGIGAIEMDITHDPENISYGLYYIDQDRLYFGDRLSGDGTTAENRPTDIDLSYFLTKINSL